ALGSTCRRPAVGAFAVVLAYIGTNALISVSAVNTTRPLVQRVGAPRMIVAGEVPLMFWKRQVMWRTDKLAGSADYVPFGQVRLDHRIVPLNLDDPRLLAAQRGDADVGHFLFLSAMAPLGELQRRA